MWCLSGSHSLWRPNTVFFVFCIPSVIHHEEPHGWLFYSFCVKFSWPTLSWPTQIVGPQPLGGGDSGEQAPRAQFWFIPSKSMVGWVPCDECRKIPATQKKKKVPPQKTVPHTNTLAHPTLRSWVWALFAGHCFKHIHQEFSGYHPYI